MDYAYQIFGNYFRDEDEFIKLSNMYRSKFMSTPGVKEISMFQKVEDEIASLLFICADKETAELVKENMKNILETHEDDVGFHTEFVYKLLDNVKIE